MLIRFVRKEIILLFVLIILASFLRLYKFLDDPPGLYPDAVSIGVNADAILHTGTDEYGQKYPLLFKSFQDYKMPLYIYITALSIDIFGKNDFAVKFPAALSGILSVLIFY